MQRFFFLPIIRQNERHQPIKTKFADHLFIKDDKGENESQVKMVTIQKDFSLQFTSSLEEHKWYTVASYRAETRPVSDKSFTF